MQKKLMAIAVAGALSAPAVVLAQASTVQIYGKLTYEYGYADLGDGRPKTDVAQTPGGSAIGFRGEEKLGGGLSAWFQCESSADIRGISGDGFCTRNSAVGLKGTFGNLHFGRWDSPFKRAIATGLVGAQETGLLGQTFVLTGGSGGSNATTRSNRNLWMRRDVGWTYYESPNFGGFQVLAAFTPGNAAAAAGVTDATVNPRPRVVSFGGIYKGGPLAAGLGYERHNDFSTIAGAGDDKAWNASVAYTFGPVKVGIAYISAEYDTGPGTELKKKNWNVGLDWAIAGPHGLEVGYTKAGDSKGNTASVAGLGLGDVAASGGDTGADLIAIKYRYAFSKRTRVRLGYVRLENDNNASYALGGTSAPVFAGENMNAVVFYAEHTF
jgi:predicted porin